MFKKDKQDFGVLTLKARVQENPKHPHQTVITSYASSLAVFDQCCCGGIVYACFEKCIGFCVYPTMRSWYFFKFKLVTYNQLS